jgi:hypothetical protein
MKGGEKGTEKGGFRAKKIPCKKTEKEEWYMRHKITLMVCMVFVVSLFVLSTNAQAMPNFARKYNSDCTMCHTIVPQLNRTGYEFRMAGYRLPSEIGKEEKALNLADFFAARIQTETYWHKHDAAGAGGDHTDTQIKFKEFTMYPLTGSWGKYFGSLAELSVGIPEEWEVENAYVRGVYGDENGWFEARYGVFHTWEGFGASDRPASLSRPLIQGKMGLGVPFKVWPGNETGIELGYYSAKTGTTVSGVVWNGMNADGEPSGKDPDQPAYNDKDLQLYVQQFISDDSAIGLFYYRGVAPFPAPTDKNPNPTQTRDTYWRLIAYANFWPVPERLDLKAGYGLGDDSLDNESVTGGKKVGKSKGFFAEADYVITPGKAEVGVRYDYLDPSDNVDHNNQTAYTAFVNLPSVQFGGLQFIGEYQHKETEQPGGGTDKDDKVALRMIFIW